jgi:diacylglycerol O-acyltransferase
MSEHGAGKGSGTPDSGSHARPHRVNTLDAAWLYVESPATPMHVGCLQVFRKPKGASRGYTGEVYQEMLRSTLAVPPFSLRPGQSRLSSLLPTWEEQPHPDLEYHLRHTALPAPGGEHELAALLSRLHSTALDMKRPLWEFYLIDGLEDHRFALFTKMHHSLVDGISGMHLLQSALSTNPRQRHMPAPWSCGRHPDSGHPAPGGLHLDEHLHGGLNQALHLAMVQLRSAPGVIKALASLAKAALPGSHSLLSAPYTAPISVFNGQASRQRHFATLRLPLVRMQDLAHRAEVKLNDVFLAILGGALRRYLKEVDALPPHSLVAGIPVSVRPKGDTTVGTAITFALSVLGTDLEQPRQRLQCVHEATVAAKEHLRGMDRAALNDYTLLLMTPYILELMAGVGGHGHPVFNVVVSNVPGPAQPLYFNGARLEQMCPMSLLTHGQALNITAISYDGQLNIGYVACKTAMPEIQRLADYTRDALDELEAAFPLKKRAPRKRAAHQVAPV